MTFLPSIKRVSVVLGGVVVIGAVVFGQSGERGFVRVEPERIEWRERPDGLLQAIIEGDMTKPGIYVVRIKFRPGIMSRPHFHGEDRHAVVLQGTWYTGIGTEFTPEKTTPLKAGSYMKHPAGAPHFDGAKDEEVIVQIVGYGPSSTTPAQSAPK